MGDWTAEKRAERTVMKETKWVDSTAVLKDEMWDYQRVGW